MKTTLVFFLAIVVAKTALSQQPNVLTKEQVNNLYNSLYLSSEIGSTGWNGSVSNCNSGTINAVIYKKAENRINFFRLINGQNEVKNNSNLNQLAQDAALLTKANNTLTHNPDKSMKCYSESAFKGCSKSCLGNMDFQNFPATAFITGYIQDLGESNYYVGHRKWVLYSKLTTFGYGATDISDALLTVDGISDDQTTMVDYVAYPWNGYVPVNLIFPKWSFSIPNNKSVDFSNTTISMFDDRGKAIAFEKLQEYKNFLDPTIVWVVKGLFSNYDIEYSQNHLVENGFLNRRIKVKISNVKVDDNIKNYEYFVEPFQTTITKVNEDEPTNQADEQIDEIWKDEESDNLFYELLDARGFIDPKDSSLCLCTSDGYLKNIDYYYVSYDRRDEFSYETITELFRINKFTKVSDFMYTKDNVTLNDPNTNHCVIWDVGGVDAFGDYLVIYDEKHVGVHKKFPNRNEYDAITNFGCSNGEENNPNCEISYDPQTRQVTRRIFAHPGDQNGIDETYKIVNGEIVKIK